MIMAKAYELYEVADELDRIAKIAKDLDVRANDLWGHATPEMRDRLDAIKGLDTDFLAFSTAAQAVATQLHAEDEAALLPDIAEHETDLMQQHGLGKQQMGLR